MTDYPNITFLDVNQDVGPMKTSWFGPIRNVHLETPGGSAEQSLTIASGAVMPAAGAARAIKLAGEGAADDILDNVTLTNVPTGALVVLRGNGTQEITLNHGAGGSGQMLLRDAVDYVLDTDAKRIGFMVVGTDLLEIWRSHPKLPEPDGETAITSGSTSVKSGISPNARRISVFWGAVDLTVAGSLLLLKIGDSGGIETGGYKRQGADLNAVQIDSIAVETNLTYGSCTLELVDPVNHTWIFAPALSAARMKTLSAGPLTQIEISTDNAFEGAGWWRIRVEE